MAEEMPKKDLDLKSLHDRKTLIMVPNLIPKWYDMFFKASHLVK